ncbi:general odorant-binding protein 45-like [Aedes albopictus]|uniref:Secreted protein n=1 Tax=Aedes albopictus TaxID=7160 RepID=A0ABM1XQU1_AEDAL
MELLAVLLSIFITFNIRYVASANKHAVVFKSIRSTDAECLQYLPNDSSNCATRCRGLVDRFWNDTSGVGYSIGRFYQPSPDDACYQNRTARCLAGVIATSSDSCQRAEQSVKCYDDQYGQLDSEAVRYIPLTRLQHIQIVKECVAMLGMSEETLKQVAINGSAIPEKSCLLRCFLIRHGLYSDEGGFDWERLELQCGGYGVGWNPRKIQQCINGIQECGKCSKVLSFADDCVNMYFRLQPYVYDKIDASVPFTVDFSIAIVSVAVLDVGF